MTASAFFLIRDIHVGSVSTSLALFLLRGYWRLIDSPRRHMRWARVLPHVVDTVLLASAVTLAVAIHQYPFIDAWLTAKVCGLLLYIVLGETALRLAKSPIVWRAAFVAALAVFAWIISIAVTRSPAGFTIWLVR